MSVIVYTESENGKFKKNAFEVASYGHKVAQLLGTKVTALSINADKVEDLGKYGVDKVLAVKDAKLETFNAKVYASCIAQAAKKESAQVIILSSSADSKYLSGILAAMLNAGYVPNVVAAPESTSPFMVKRTAFSNKGFAHTEINADTKIIGVSNNSFGVVENTVSAQVETFEPNINDNDFGTKSVEVDKVVGKATIADADIVVSAGRGMKGPENWGMIEELADVLGAATACSKPVSDLGWRPHGEHVGQTGKPVASNLYIAIGISGAIQHLAGVSASKTKVVINNDPEAPFFKAADYGIVGDAFEVVPQLIEKLKVFKAQNA
ncbi:MAG: electron transfer flavoprotein subunit alpha/FixB family protein [Croceitalea sp.]|nr:electron transfer flavoprotein subunit alpha/FixB family protein [Croceitalea sp.]MBT8238129.1 electron transfer flavoprotein subunit alpha/FixB family protein [Croceitalea sp.]NNC34893.1 electron transfer flavoprotein subunit alpha/FixB family protein [Croceitalea sp.]NNL08286.1 electron transfer flavoprotein subunit alpha/FixB family protein [Croceitalea sp.]NNM18467.1 electron transfer flavoprotein subunit alpha/FixB family protein [Croceitalea sp.]